MKPTIDITAAVLLKESLLASHAEGSGNVSRNHSWKTGGNLVIFSEGSQENTNQDVPRKNIIPEKLCRIFVWQILDFRKSGTHFAGLSDGQYNVEVRA